MKQLQEQKHAAIKMNQMAALSHMRSNANRKMLSRMTLRGTTTGVVLAGREEVPGIPEIEESLVTIRPKEGLCRTPTNLNIRCLMNLWAPLEATETIMPTMP